MALKKISNKLKVALKILRDEGVLSLLILCTRFIEKTLIKISSQKIDKHLINVHVKYRDALRADYTSPKHIWKGTNSKQLTFNWIMSPPGRGSGGHQNAYRFINYLEKAGHRCKIYIYTQHAPGRISDIKNLMGDSYPKINASMEWINDGDEIADCDGIFATSWETAYASFNSKSIGKRFYFVQDFEPFFYATGSLSSLAENTYKFGFYGVTAGNWLATKLKRDFGMETDYFDFGSDKSIYNYTNSQPRKEIFFYARPHTERRGFEMGIMALDLFHQKHPDYVINLAGWDVSSYHIPFPYNNLQTLEIDQLNSLYNRCSAGLVLSLTNMSLLPLELLSSGTIPVVNDGENNRLVSNNPFIAYTENNPKALANKLSEVISRNDAVSYSKKASESVNIANWDDSGKKFVEIVERETKKL